MHLFSAEGQGKLWFPAAVLLMGEERDGEQHPDFPEGCQFWEAQSTLRQLRNQAEDSFLLNHSSKMPHLHIHDPEINQRE